MGHMPLKWHHKLNNTHHHSPCPKDVFVLIPGTCDIVPYMTKGALQI